MKTLREKMFQEMQELKIFEQAQGYAFDYAEKALTRNVYPTDEAIDNLDKLDAALPDGSGDPSSILRELHDYGSPATVSQIGGRYFGMVNGGVIPASLAARWISDFWDQNSPLYTTSPIASKLESVVENWLKELFGLGDDVVAGFVSGTSMAIFCGLAAARFRIYEKLNWDVNQAGLYGAPKIRLVTGKHAHGAVLKAVSLLGFGLDSIEWVDVDDQGRILVESVPELDERTILILQAGNVGSGSFDDFEVLCKKANEAGAWVHIDGAFGLWAAATTKLNHLTNGAEKADSWSVDAHKTLNAPYDNGILLCNDSEALVKALQVAGSYIPYSENRDGMLYTPEMSRRARVVELWAALKYLGKSGIDELVYGFHLRAVQFAEEFKVAGFEVVNDVVFNQVMISCETDDRTNRIMKHVQYSGECWAGGATWEGRAVIRVSVCSWATTEADVSRSVAAFVAGRESIFDEKNQ